MTESTPPPLAVYDQATCPRCGAVFHYRDSQAGRITECGSCGAPITLPSPVPRWRRWLSRITFRRAVVGYAITAALFAVALSVAAYLVFGRQAESAGGSDEPVANDAANDEPPLRYTPEARKCKISWEWNTPNPGVAKLQVGRLDRRSTLVYSAAFLEWDRAPFLPKEVRRGGRLLLSEADYYYCRDVLGKDQAAPWDLACQVLNRTYEQKGDSYAYVLELMCPVDGWLGSVTIAEVSGEMPDLPLDDNSPRTLVIVHFVAMPAAGESDED